MVLKQKSAAMVAVVVAIFGVCGAFVSYARADLKLEQTVHVSGVPKMDNGKMSVEKPTTEITVMYYKNGKQRIETADSVMIHDTATEKTFLLNPPKKTYYEAPSAASVATDPSNPMAQMAELDGDVVVTDLKEDKSILGKKAHHYSYVMTLKFTVKDPKAPAMMASFLPSFVIIGDQWMAEVPDSLAFAKRNTQSVFEGLPSGLGKNFQTLTGKMGTMKGIPLEMTHSSKMSFGESAPAMIKEQMPKEPTVRKTTTTSLSEDPLPDALFVVPDDYKKVTAPGVVKKSPNAA